MDKSPSSQTQDLTQQQPYFKYIRKKSRRACQTCSKRKVKCDVTSKLHPGEKCTNCEEFGIECKVVERRKKRTKAEMEAERFRKRAKLLLSQSDSDSNVLTSPNMKPYQQQPQSSDDNDHDESINSSTSQHDADSQVIVSSDLFSSKKVDPFKLSQFYNVLATHSGLRETLQDYFVLNGDIRLSDIVSQEAIELLKSSGCFVLPNETRCKLYIEAYFESFHRLYPCILRDVFERDFKDLTNPPSLLLLRVILYIGCQIIAKTEEELSESRMLHEKARLVYSLDCEPNGIYLTTSAFLFSVAPCSQPTLRQLEDHFASAVRFANAFGMHKNVDNSKHLTPEEQLCYKRIFWTLLVGDRVLSVTMSRDFNFNSNSCSVNPLTKSDFSDLGEYQDECFMYYESAVSLQFVINKITDLQRKANSSSLKSLPITPFIQQINLLIESYYTALPPEMKDPSHSIGSLSINIFLLSLALLVQRGDLFRFHVILHRNIKSESVSPASSHYLESENIDYALCWSATIEIAHRMSVIACSSLLKFEKYLPFDQLILCMVFQGSLALVHGLCHTNEAVRKLSNQDLRQIIPILDKVYSYNSWHVTKVCNFIWKSITRDKDTLTRYIRIATNAKHIEDTSFQVAKYPLLRTLALQAVPPLTGSIFKLEPRLKAMFLSKHDSPIFHPSYSLYPYLCHINGSELLQQQPEQPLQLPLPQNTVLVPPFEFNSRLDIPPVSIALASTIFKEAEQDIGCFEELQETLPVQIGDTRPLDSYFAQLNEGFQVRYPTYIGASVAAIPTKTGSDPGVSSTAISSIVPTNPGQPQSQPAQPTQPVQPAQPTQPIRSPKTTLLPGISTFRTMHVPPLQLNSNYKSPILPHPKRSSFDLTSFTGPPSSLSPLPPSHHFTTSQAPIYAQQMGIQSPVEINRRSLSLSSVGSTLPGIQPVLEYLPKVQQAMNSQKVYQQQPVPLPATLASTDTVSSTPPSSATSSTHPTFSQHQSSSSTTSSSTGYLSTKR